MKIAIISDTHDCEEKTKKLAEALNSKTEILIHCGDLCAPFMLSALREFKGKIYVSLGLSDGDVYKILEIANKNNIKVFDNLGEIEVDKKKIAFCHLPAFAEGLAYTGKYDAVFYGHTHKIDEKKIGKCLLVNPGEIIGRVNKSSYAVYDTEKNKIDFLKI